ncbi:MAG: 2Fe-2S iron-sulfur cluster binding domain-containing protein [Gammaproteobacteria bacterium]|nr:2Fe-2S iron-sulfur cluster binding domain-containing protein [Gammaproteobacteria bacterium]
MDRLVSISRAAKLVGVSRGNLQRRVQDGELESFEGQLLLSDLARVFPDATLEDNTMLEKLERIIEHAAIKARNRTTSLPPDMETLAARVNLLTEDLIEAKLEISIFYNIMDKLKARLNTVSRAHPQLSDSLRDLQAWLLQEIESVSEKKMEQFPLLTTDNILRLVAAQVRIEPSGHEYFVEGSNSILESGLSAGLALNYGCSNGNCGKCKARLLSGEIKKIRTHDYVLTEKDKLQGYFLACSNTAVTDIIISADEAGSEQDIPLQTFQARVRKIEMPLPDLCVLNIKTPRTQRLRFLAGQKVKLETPGVGAMEAHVASCPCEDMHLQFHLHRDSHNPFTEHVFSHLKANDVINIEGPVGHFVLREDETNPIVFIAFGEGFAPIKSLIEHAMTLDVTEHIDLFWAVTDNHELYMHNNCRAWSDAFERFSYSPVIGGNRDMLANDVMQMLSKEHPQLDGYHFYIAGPDKEVAAMQSALQQQGVESACVFSDTLA